MKALITGGAGFIGLHLARQLASARWQVDILDNFARGANDANVRAVATQGSVRVLDMDLARLDIAALETNYTHVFHLAAIVGVANVINAPWRVLTINQRLTEASLQLARRQQALQRYVFLSTSEVYAGAARISTIAYPTTESTPLVIAASEEPRTTYLLSKIYGEAMCQHAGLPYTIFRPHNIYGPRMGMAHVIPELVQKCMDIPPDQPLAIASSHHTRTFCYVEDAIEYLELAAVNPACIGKILNLGVCAPETTIHDLAVQIVRLVGRPHPLVAAADTPGSPTRRIPDTATLIALTGKEPRISLAEGLDRTVAWYRAEIARGTVTG